MRWDWAFLEQHSARYFLRPELPPLGSGLYISHVHCFLSTNYDRQSGMLWSDESFSRIVACFYFGSDTGVTSFGMAILGDSVRRTGSRSSETLDVIHVYAKILPKDYDPIQDSACNFFNDLQGENPGWKRLADPDVSCIPAYHQQPTGRQMKLFLSDELEVIITVQWYYWRGRWHEDLAMEVVEMPEIRSNRPSTICQ